MIVDPMAGRVTIDWQRTEEEPGHFVVHVQYRPGVTKELLTALLTQLIETS